MELARVSDFDAAQPDAGAVDLKSLVLHGLGRSWPWVLVLAALGTAAGLLASLALPNEYAALGKIMVRLGAREQRTPESAVDPELPQSATTGILDELEILDDRGVFVRVAQALGPELLLQPYDPEAGDGPFTPRPMQLAHRLQSRFFRWRSGPPVDASTPSALDAAAELLQESTTLYNPRGTNVLHVESRWHSAETARQVVDAFLTVAQAWHKEYYAGDEQLRFTSELLATAVQNLKDAEERFRLHRDECGFTDLESEKGRLIDGIHDLRDEIDRAAVRWRQINELLAFLEAELASIQPLIERTLPVAEVSNPDYDAVLKELRNAIEELTSFAKVYVEGSPAYQKRKEQIEARIAQLESERDALEPYITLGGSRTETVTNPEYEEAVKQRRELLQERRGLVIAKQGNDELVADQERRLANALLCEPVHRTFELEIFQLQNRVDQLVDAKDESEVLEQIDREELMSSLEILQRPSVPGVKVGPERLKFLLIGIFGGLAAGMAFTFLRQVLDDRVRYPERLEPELGIALIGVVPEDARWRKWSRGLGDGLGERS